MLGIDSSLSKMLVCRGRNYLWYVAVMVHVNLQTLLMKITQWSAGRKSTLCQFSGFCPAV